jgi:dTDP-4-amino-4,6-dideoxygalactose transaminase
MDSCCVWDSIPTLKPVARMNMTNIRELCRCSVGKTTSSEFFLATCEPAHGAWPFFAIDEIEAAVHVMQSGKVNYWTGDEGRQFETEFAEYVGGKHAIALANGSLALECALKVLGIGSGDEVVTTSRTFIASASCAVMVGARPVCADVDGDSQNITAESIRKVLTPRTKAIIAVHLAGWPCEMDAILDLAHERGLYVVEDCAQAHGATYRGRPVGSIGDIGAFSFCQDKIISTGGEGGMIIVNSDEMFESAWAYKDHGKSYDAVYRRVQEPGFRWLHESFGTNWRLTEMQSAIGRVQLRKLPLWLSIRRKYARILTSEFATIPGLRVTVPPEHIEHAYYKYYTFVRPELLRPEWTRNRIIEAINAEGVRCFNGSCSEIYLEKAFPLEWRPQKRHAVARELGETSLMFLVHPTLTEEHIHATSAAVKKVMSLATGLTAPTKTRDETGTLTL